MDTYQPVPDPFLNKDSVLPPGSADFYERQEPFLTIQNLLLSGASVSLVGERKAGKTSFLNHLQANLSSEHFVVVPCKTLETIAPRTDKMFLSELASGAAKAITTATNTKTPKLKTSKPSAEGIYEDFKADLNALRSKLPLAQDGQPRRLIWLLDEIEMLRSYENTNLFNFLRPLAQADSHFRFVVAGYDVLYTLANISNWSPFFSAFTPVRLEGFNPVTARQLVDDALLKMGATLAPDLYEPVLSWTGQKPYYLKWVLSKIAETLNQRQVDHHITMEVWQITQTSTLGAGGLYPSFKLLWQNHATETQRHVLAAAAVQNTPCTYIEILNALKGRTLLSPEYTEQHFIDDLIRLQQLGFIYERVGSYTFTSGCLQAWITANKPL